MLQPGHQHEACRCCSLGVTMKRGMQELDLPDMAAALHLAGLGGGTGAKKLGEGTYGEAFRMGTSVVKILPFTREPCHKEGEDSMLSAADILAEAAIMQELNALRRGGVPASCRCVYAMLCELCTQHACGKPSAS